MNLITLSLKQRLYFSAKEFMMNKGPRNQYNEPRNRPLTFIYDRVFDEMTDTMVEINRHVKARVEMENSGKVIPYY